MVTAKFLPFILAPILLLVSAAEAKSKYGPNVKPLSAQTDYFRNNPAPDFWRMISHLVPQKNGAACSIATAAIIFNAVRGTQTLTQEDEIWSQDEILKKIDWSDWTRRVGLLPKGMTLDLLETGFEKGFQKLKLGAYQIEATRPMGPSDADLNKFTETLIEKLTENEKSDSNFIVINFDQGIIQGDKPAGHIAAIGAFDSKTRSALILDPDKGWYEPYWVPVETLAKSMATIDPESKKFRGYLWIRRE